MDFGALPWTKYEIDLTMRIYNDSGALPTRDGVNALPVWDWKQAPKVVLQNGTHGNVRTGPQLSAVVHRAEGQKAVKSSEKQGKCPVLSAPVGWNESVHHLGLEPTENGVFEPESKDGTTKRYLNLPSDLLEVIHAWDELADPVKQTIRMIVDANAKHALSPKTV